VRTTNALMIGKCEGSEIRGMTPNFNVRPGRFVSGAISDATLAGHDTPLRAIAPQRAGASHRKVRWVRKSVMT
jgi:hypothetical protein